MTYHALFRSSIRQSEEPTQRGAGVRLEEGMHTTQSQIGASIRTTITHFCDGTGTGAGSSLRMRAGTGAGTGAGVSVCVCVCVGVGVGVVVSVVLPYCSVHGVV